MMGGSAWGSLFKGVSTLIKNPQALKALTYTAPKAITYVAPKAITYGTKGTAMATKKASHLRKALNAAQERAKVMAAEPPKPVDDLANAQRLAAALAAE